MNPRKNKHRRAVVFAAAVAALVLTAGHSVGAPGSGGRVSCSFEPAEGRLVVLVRGEQGDAGELSAGIIKRRGAQIRVIRHNEQSERFTVVNCGGNPTITSVDTVALYIVDGRATISLAGGPLAPGATAEPEGGPEIEITARNRRGVSSLFVVGTGDDDHFRFGSQGFKGANLNAGAETHADDVDLVIEGEPFHFLQAAGGDGDDWISAWGGHGTGSGLLLSRFIATGGAGDDLLTAAARGGVVVGGGGDDRLSGSGRGDTLIGGFGRNWFWGGGGADDIDTGDGSGVVWAGPGHDRIDGEEGDPISRPGDRIRCMRGNDYVDADRGDRIGSCERGTRPNGTPL